LRNFLEQTRETWHLEEPLAHLALKWAARLHEIGLDVSPAAITGTAPICSKTPTCRAFRAKSSGCSRVWVRRSPRSSPRGVEGGAAVGSQRAAPDLLLRLAVLLQPRRSTTALAGAICRRRHAPWKYAFRPWLKEHPLTSADLQAGSGYLRASGFRLRVFVCARLGSNHGRAERP